MDILASELNLIYRSVKIHGSTESSKLFFAIFRTKLMKTSREDRIDIRYLLFAYEVANSLEGPDFIFRLREMAIVYDYGIVSGIMSSSENLGVALARAIKYEALFTRAIFTTVDVLSPLDCVVQLTSSNQDNSHDFSLVFEKLFLDFVPISRHITNTYHSNTVRLKKVTFQHSPRLPIECYEKLFGCKVSFNCKENSIRFPKRILKLPIYSANPDLVGVHLMKAKQMLTALNETNYAGKVRSYLMSTDRPRRVRVERIADHYNMSPSTLKRKLKFEGASISEITDDVLKSLTRIMLSNGMLTKSEIAERLGYSDPTSFSRARKRWNTSGYNSLSDSPADVL